MRWYLQFFDDSVDISRFVVIRTNVVRYALDCACVSGSLMWSVAAKYCAFDGLAFPLKCRFRYVGYVGTAALASISTSAMCSSAAAALDVAVASSSTAATVCDGWRLLLYLYVLLWFFRHDV